LGRLSYPLLSLPPRKGEGEMDYQDSSIFQEGRRRRVWAVARQSATSVRNSCNGVPADSEVTSP
jgi:hypothetical protein